MKPKTQKSETQRPLTLILTMKWNMLNIPETWKSEINTPRLKTG